VIEVFGPGNICFKLPTNFLVLVFSFYSICTLFVWVRHHCLRFWISLINFFITILIWFSWFMMWVELLGLWLLAIIYCYDLLLDGYSLLSRCKLVVYLLLLAAYYLLERLERNKNMNVNKRFETTYNWESSWNRSDVIQ